VSIKAEVVWDISEPMRILPELRQKLYRGLYAIDARIAQEGEAYMKQNAKWQDQTGNARAALSGTSAASGSRGGGVMGTTHVITYSHGVPYGIWLEVRWGGRYAILKPTVELFGRKYMEMVSGLIDRIGGS
jgi:hypothetical protein